MPLPTSKLPPPVKRPPSSRSLRVYAFDPSFNWKLDTAVINRMTLDVPWEELGHGPVGEYLEVVDVDPASGCCYAPVDLNDPNLLAMDGLDPAEGDPQFHQQMVYAVAMTTIRNFERALGRRVFWSEAGKEQDYAFVRRLRIYPHALREANAYYSPQRKALLFGYFPASTSDPGHNLPGGTVFTCLSHDIIAHETTHALLDGLHRRFIEPSNQDVLAFHEAFADVVALFQHFSFPEVLRHQIARTRGDLASQNLLGGARATSSARPSAATAPCATPWGRSTRTPGSGGPRNPIRPTSRPPASPTAAAPSWWRRSSTPSSPSTSRASPTCCASPPAARACSPRAPSTLTSWTAWPGRRPSPPGTS